MSGQKKSNDPESAKLVEGTKDDFFEEDKNHNSCSRCCAGCCRLLFAILLFPFVFVLTLLAIIVWLILCPLRCCSPCLGPVIDLIVKILTLPLRLLRWVTGSSDKDGAGSTSKQ